GAEVGGAGERAEDDGVPVPAAAGGPGPNGEEGCPHQVVDRGGGHRTARPRLGEPQQVRESGGEDDADQQEEHPARRSPRAAARPPPPPPLALPIPSPL